MKYIPLLALLVLVMPFSARAETVDATGLWLTENERSVIEVSQCGVSLCGNIYWIIEGGMEFDSKNPDEAKRGTPMCGLPILWGMTPTGPETWAGGKIYKADEGDIYNATMQMLPTGKLLVRGYVGMPLLGKSQVWERVKAEDYARCKPAK